MISDKQQDYISESEKQLLLDYLFQTCEPVPFFAVIYYLTPTYVEKL